MIKRINGRLTVLSNTPRIRGTNPANRAYRRWMYYGGKVWRLRRRIVSLRDEMIEAGVYPPSMVKSMSRKVLSGYYGRLRELAVA